MDGELKKLINDFAQELIDTYKITVPITNINMVVSQFGGEIRTDETLSGYSDGYIRKVNDSFEVVISPFQSDTRRNFTIAHELGHLFLHMGFILDIETWSKQDGRSYYRNGSNDEELQANEFAAAFLMPKKIYKEIIDKNTNGNTVNITEIANYFNVSVYAASNRGKWLGYLQW